MQSKNISIGIGSVVERRDQVLQRAARVVGKLRKQCLRLGLGEWAHLDLKRSVTEFTVMVMVSLLTELKMQIQSSLAGDFFNFLVEMRPLCAQKIVSDCLSHSAFTTALHGTLQQKQSLIIEWPEFQQLNVED